MYMSPFWSNERRGLASNKNSLENIFPLWLYKTNEGTCLHCSGLSLTDCLLYKNVILHETLATGNEEHGRMFTQFVLSKTYCWVVLNIWLCRHDLPNLVSLLFRFSGQRYGVKESYGGSELGFSYCTWSSRIKKKIKRKSQKPYDKTT